MCFANARVLAAVVIFHLEVQTSLCHSRALESSHTCRCALFPTQPCPFSGMDAVRSLFLRLMPCHTIQHFPLQDLPKTKKVNDETYLVTRFVTRNLGAIYRTSQRKAEIYMNDNYIFCSDGAELVLARHVVVSSTFPNWFSTQCCGHRRF